LWLLQAATAPQTRMTKRGEGYFKIEAGRSGGQLVADGNVAGSQRQDGMGAASSRTRRPPSMTPYSIVLAAALAQQTNAAGRPVFFQSTMDCDARLAGNHREGCPLADASRACDRSRQVLLPLDSVCNTVLAYSMQSKAPKEITGFPEIFCGEDKRFLLCVQRIFPLRSQDPRQCG
jgi:hypothetical protein